MSREPPWSRNADPLTSHMAAASFVPGAKTHRDLVLLTLAEAGPSTHDELARLCGLRPDQVWRRLPELAEAGLIQQLTTTRAGTSGRQQCLWRLPVQQQELQL